MIKRKKEKRERKSIFIYHTVFIEQSINQSSKNNIT